MAEGTLIEINRKDGSLPERLDDLVAVASPDHVFDVGVVVAGTDDEAAACSDFPVGVES